MKRQSLLAKLLATENITINEGVFKTASFDLESRVLCLPINIISSKDVQELFIGHEVGHALFTPLEGNHHAQVDLGIPQPILNVLEDVRIERLMKKKYPGFNGVFLSAYKELVEKEFFGDLSEEVVAKANFIDRLNLFAKCGAKVIFTEKEKSFVSRAFLTETFDDVIKLATELMENKESLINSQQTEQLTPSEKSCKLIEFDESITDGEFRRNEEASNAINSPGDVFILPKDLEQNWKNYVISYQECSKLIASCLGKSPDAFTIEQTNEFFTSCRSQVNHMAIQFEAKKAADINSKTRTSTKGNIDFNKLINYKISDNIFSSIEILPIEQNHAMVMLVDFSGSMESCIKNVLHQSIILCLFCKRMKIPFELYGFSSYKSGPSCEEGEINLSSVSLINLLSCNMKNLEFNEAVRNLYRISYRIEQVDGPFELCSTPLNESMILIENCIKELYRNGIQKVSLINLTDGVPDSMRSESGHIGNGILNIYGEYIRYDENIGFYHYMCKRLKNLGTNIIGVHLVGHIRDINNFLKDRNFDTNHEHKEISCVRNMLGIDVQFFIDSYSLRYSSQYEGNNETKLEINNSFIQTQICKKKTLKFLNLFIESIA